MKRRLTIADRCARAEKRHDRDTGDGSRILYAEPGRFKRRHRAMRLLERRASSVLDVHAALPGIDVMLSGMTNTTPGPFNGSLRERLHEVVFEADTPAGKAVCCKYCGEPLF